jgi:hypothetical protein
MRQPTKGPVLKERVWCFIEALLTRAEDSSDFEVHWEDGETDRLKMVVKTRRRFLEEVANLKQSQIYEVINSLKKLELLEDRRFKQKRGSDVWCFALKLWSRDAQRNREQFERVWEGSRTAKSKALEATFKKAPLTPQFWGEQDQTTSVLPPKVGGAGGGIDWRDVCRNRLEKPKQLTTNRLMSAKQMLFDINQICVDLALVERKQPDKRSGDDNPEQSQLYKPDYEETQKLEYEEFLATVLKASQSNKIAIIGEPGAGKTTLLQRIAFWILDNTNGLPIWIPLGNLPTPAPKLKDYLHNWLEDAILNVTPKIRAEFEGLLTAGRVWLLLDGVDEMVANSGSPLSFIDKWIPGWCQQLSVVLTCRLNVWEANPHALNNFQTYRTLEFSQEKVNEFIEACFQESNPALGTQLQQALNQPGKERIKDLMRNPLRLTLLCSIWHLRDGKLPDTKAELYQQYVEEVYRWKKDEFRTEPEERKQLNAKLKELALAAIDKEENRFCLRHKFVEGILGDPDGSVFQLALNIGWLNRVGVDAKNPNPNQPVYAFFHPTFQEYFAALAIADWDFFLPRAHDNRNPKPVSERYRIFEPQWKEVIVLWLGRDELVREQKEKFIEALVEFKDGIKYQFYGYRAYFLAAAGITEFWDCCLAHQIVRTIISISFGYFNISKQKWVKATEPIAQRAREVLQETYRERVVQELIDILPIILDDDARQEAAFSLGQIDPGNSLAIQTLIQLTLESTRNLAFWNLRQIAKGNLLAIQTLIQFIERTENDDLLSNAVQSLGQIGEDNPLAIKTLTKLVQKDQDKWLRCTAAKSLGQSNLGKTLATETLTELVQTSQDESLRCIAACDLKQIDKYNYLATQTLNELAQTAQNDSIRQLATRSLEQDNDNRQLVTQKNTGLIDESFEAIIEAMMQTHENELFHGSKLMRHLYATLLVKNLQGDYLQLAVFRLKNCLTEQLYKNDRERFNDCYSVILHCAENMTYPDFYQAWHQQEEVDNTTTPDRQTLNQADLPQSIHSAIANDPQLSQIIHLICIDGSQFIDPDRPAAEIYDQMLDQNCPECEPVPETMHALKLYWNSLRRKSNKHPVLVFYASSTDATPDEGTTLSCPYSEGFLTVLSKFGREICAIAEQRFEHIPLKFFTPIQPIEDIVQWIRAIVLEN